jgi:hypothetical protein
MLSQAISYIGASVSSVVSLSVPSSGGLSLTVTGRNGGQAVYSAGIRIGASAAQATLWLSDSASIAKSSAGLEIALYVSISMSRWSTLLALSSCISYAAPIASSVRLTNFPSSGATIVSIFGSGLGGIAGSAKVRAGSTACSSSIWQSFSSISCKVASGNDRSSSVQLSAGFMTMSQVLLRSTTLFPLLSSTLLAFCSKCGAVGCNASTLVYSAIRRVLAFLAVWFRRNIAQR